MPDGYHCEECGASVMVTLEGRIIRSCGHQATVVCGMGAVTLTGEGQARQAGIIDWLRKIGIAAMRRLK